MNEEILNKDRTKKQIEYKRIKKNNYHKSVKILIKVCQKLLLNIQVME